MRSPHTRRTTDRELGDPEVRFWMKTAGSHPRLSAQEELDLARRYQAGDEAAFDALVTSNMRLVLAYTRRYQGQGLPLIDLLQEGAKGLMHGITKFDPERGVRLSTYVVPWIKQRALRALQDCGRTIRLPVHIQKKGLVDGLAKVVASLDAPTHESACLGDLIEGEGPGQLEEFLNDEGKELLQNLILRLPPREAEVIRLRFYEGWTLQRIGVHLELSRERIRQIENNALRSLRTSASSVGLVA